MSSFVPGISRVPDFLVARQGLNSITRVSAELFGVQDQLATGRSIFRPSQDPVRSAAIAELNEDLARSGQRLRNLETSEGALNVLDSALGEATTLAQEARSLALAQLSAGSDASERAAQATVVNSMIESLLRISNRESIVGHIFGGTEPGRPPIEEVNGAFRFVGGIGQGLTPDLSAAGTGFSGRAIPVTLGAANAVGAISGRVRGSVDYQPALTPDTLLADLNGARNLGVRSGSIEIDVGGTEPVRVDLSGADTIGDVTDLIEAEIRDYELLNSTTVLGPSGVSLSGAGIQIDAAVPISFGDVAGSETARDLGLLQDPVAEFAAGVGVGLDLGPKVTLRTPVSALQGVTGGLGSVRISNNGVTRDLDLSGAETVGDVKSILESANMGVKVVVNDLGTGINIVSELSTSSDRALSISETGDGSNTATRLGIRSFDGSTRIEDLNFGRGVEALEGRPDAALNVDFEIELGDGFVIPIDLSSGDLGTVGSVIAAIESQADAALAAAGRPVTDVTVGLTDGPNGIAIEQAAGIGGPVTINQRNNSPAAQQLGLQDGVWDPANQTLVGEDVGTVRVESLFTHLLDLRDGLTNDDTFGMTLAADGVQDSADRLSQSRALVGGFARRVVAEQNREEERNAVDTQIRSSLQDADFAQAASQFTQLQTQLEAGLRVASLSGQLTLLSFLG
ncbi:MAG: flagellin [Planctomycetota bacterium]